MFESWLLLVAALILSPCCYNRQPWYRDAAFPGCVHYGQGINAKVCKVYSQARTCRGTCARAARVHRTRARTATRSPHRRRDTFRPGRSLGFCRAQQARGGKPSDRRSETTAAGGEKDLRADWACPWWLVGRARRGVAKRACVRERELCMC